VRIAPKAVTTNTPTPPAASGKSAGASFLDILLTGSGVDFLGVKASSGSGTQTGSDTSSDPAQDQDEKSQATSFQGLVDASASAASSAAENNTTQIQSNGLENNQTLVNASVAASTSIFGGLVSPAKLDAAQLLAAAQPPSHSTGKAGKQSTPSVAATAVDAATVAAFQNATIQANALTPLTVPAQALSSADPLIAGGVQTDAAVQTATHHDRQQIAEASQPVPSKAQQNAASQSIANEAQNLQSKFAAALPSTAQFDPQSLSQQNAAGTSADGTAAKSSEGPTVTAQSANPQSSGTVNLPVASTFLSAAILPNTVDVNQLAGKGSQYKTSATTFNTNSSVSGAATATSAAKTGSQDAPGTPSRSTQNGNDTTQHGQTDASQITTVAAKPNNDSGAAQPMAFATVAAAHQTASIHTTSGSADEAPHRTEESGSLASESLNAAGTTASSGINTARVIQSMSETEMRVGMRSTEFGDISIRTMVSQQQMQTQISVDHSELSNAISAHIPAMQAKLDNQYGLHASIEVSQGGASFSGQREQSSQRDQKAFTPSVPLEIAAPAADMDRTVLRVPSVSILSDRLDIRA
jgi:hypothetical protein